MSEKVSLHKLMEELQSNSPDILIPALDQSVSVVREFSGRILKAVEDPDLGLFVAERFYQLIATTIEEVEKFFASTTDAEAKVQAGVMLLLLGSKSGVPCLLDALAGDYPEFPWLAHKLANAGIEEAKEAIITRLWRTDHPAQIESLLVALKKLGGELPPDLESNYLAADAPVEVREFVQEEWLHLPPNQMSPGEILRA